MSLALAVVALAAACPTGAVAQSQQGPILSPSVASRAGLDRMWFAQAAVDGARSELQHAIIQNERLFLSTSENVVEAIDAVTGRSMWRTRVGRAFTQLSPPGAGAPGVAAISGTDVFLLDRDDGQILWRTRTPGVAMAAPVVTNEWVYAALMNGQFRAFPIENPELVGGSAKQPWFSGHSGTIDMAPVASRELIIWATNRGAIYASRMDRRGLVFQAEVSGRLSAPLAFWPPYLYVMDETNTLTAMSAEFRRSGGETAWEYNVGGPVTQKPVPLDSQVFIIRDDFGMICLQATPPKSEDQPQADDNDEERPASRRRPAAQGTPLWMLPGVKQFASATKDRVYGLDREGRLMIIDRKKGNLLAILPTQATPVAVTNNVNDRIFLWSPLGTMVALREDALTQPVKHTWPSLEREPAEIQIGGPN